MNNHTPVTIPFSISHTPTQEKIALLELEMCYLQVRSCLSQVWIIRISQQTSSLTVSVFVLVNIQINFNERTFLITFLLKTSCNLYFLGFIFALKVLLSLFCFSGTCLFLLLNPSFQVKYPGFPTS